MGDNIEEFSSSVGSKLLVMTVHRNSTSGVSGRIRRHKELFKMGGARYCLGGREDERRQIVLVVVVMICNNEFAQISSVFNSDYTILLVSKF